MVLLTGATFRGLRCGWIACPTESGGSIAFAAVLGGFEAVDAGEVFVDVFLCHAGEGAIHESIGESTEFTFLESVEFACESLHPLGWFESGADAGVHEGGDVVSEFEEAFGGIFGGESGDAGDGFGDEGGHMILDEWSDDSFVHVIMETWESNTVFFFEGGEFVDEFFSDEVAFFVESVLDFAGDGLFISFEENFVNDLPGDGIPFEAVVEGFDAEEVEEAVEAAAVV